MGENFGGEYDVIIVGAGPAGLSFAKSISNVGLKIAVIEKAAENSITNPAYDGREIALNHEAVSLLRTLGAWQHLPENSISLIRKAKVFDGKSSYSLNFDFRDTNKNTLGYIVSNHEIKRTLYKTLEAVSNVTVIYDTEVASAAITSDEAHVILSDGSRFTSKLLVAADSRFSAIRRDVGIGAYMNDFGRTAIVCQITHDAPHYDTAYEYFQYGRTLAVLPLEGNMSSIVVTLPTDAAETLLNLGKSAFTADIQGRLKNQFGKMKLVSERFSYPLVGVFSKKFAAHRFALIGDAAVGMHPVTAHGFNLGIKGQNTLTKEIKSALLCGLDIGNISFLNKYGKAHQRLSRPIYEGTNALVKLYTDETILAHAARAALLRVGNIFSPGKRVILNQLTSR